MTEEQIRAGFFQMAQSAGPVMTNIAKVKAVDEEKALCTLEDELYGVYPYFTLVRVLLLLLCVTIGHKT